METRSGAGEGMGPRVVIIGGGGTGLALAHDLTLRNFSVDLLERGELTSGTTGRHHGLLHSGARYVMGDPATGAECMQEVRILQKIVPEAIESNYGLFVALNDDDISYLPRFLDACGEADIPTRPISGDEARHMEPRLSPEVISAVVVPDGTMDAWRLPLSFAASAWQNGARIHIFNPVIDIETKNRQVTAVIARSLHTGEERRFECDIVINAAGVWAGKIAAMCGADVGLSPGPGSMLAVKGRLTNMVINRLHLPSSGDIIVPQRQLSIIGATQWDSAALNDTTDLEVCTVLPDEIPLLTKNAAMMVPEFAHAPFHAAWSAVRPLKKPSSGATSGHAISRQHLCIDHGIPNEYSDEKIEGLMSIIGGKATLLRRMAEDMADMICKKLNIDAPCTTADTPLQSYRKYLAERSA